MEQLHDNNVTHSLEKLSHILSTHIPTEVKDFYIQKFPYIREDIFSYFQENWYSYSPIDYTELDISRISTIIHYILWNAYEYPVLNGGQSKSEEDSLEDYRLAKKNKKDFLYRVIREEYEVFTGKRAVDKRPRTTKYLKESWLANTNAFLTERIVTISQEEFYKQEYEQVHQWHKVTADYIFNFPYFDTLPAKSRVLYIIQDIGWIVFNIIKTEFYGNIEGYLTKTPDLSLGMKKLSMPIVNWQSSAIALNDLQFEADDNSITVSEIIANNGGQLKITVDVIRNVDCSTDEKKQIALKKITDEYRSGERVGRLDTTDFSILSAILNFMNHEIITGKKPLLVSFTELALKVFNGESSISLKKCNSFFNHLLKLSKMSIAFTELDANGIPVASEQHDFFKFKYSISGTFASRAENLSPLPRNAELDLSGEANIPNIDALNKDHYNHMTLQLIPGEYLRSQYISQLSTGISTIVYQSLPSPKAKVLVKLFLEDRFRTMPTLTSRITMKYIETQVRVASGEIRRLKNDIIEILAFLKEKQMIVDDYTVNRGSFDITYLAFTDHEKAIYGYEELPAQITSS